MPDPEIGVITWYEASVERIKTTGPWTADLYATYLQMTGETGEREYQHHADNSDVLGLVSRHREDYVITESVRRIVN